MRKITGLLLAVIILITTLARAEWYKGNTHTHTVNSDGDSSPDAVVRWYKEHDYNFVVITDHNFLTNVRGLNEIFAAEGKFLVIPGEEVTDKLIRPDSSRAPVHFCAINLQKKIIPAGGKSIAGILQADVNSINAAGAVAQINHPNFRWAFGVEEMYAVNNCSLFEVANFSTDCNDYGEGGMPATEALWDSLLSRGRLIYGVASDDTHELKNWGQEYSNPGRGWVMVRGNELTAPGIAAALARGDFYSSNGIILKDIKVDSLSYTVEIEKIADEDTKYTVYFIGRGGRILATVSDNPAVYKITGKEGYVRARVADSNGLKAWTQPVFTGSE